MRTMCVVLLFAGFLPASAGAAEPPSKTVAPAATQPPNEGAKAKAKLLFQAGKAEQAAGHLDEAELRPIGRVAHEFGVERHIGGLR